MTKFKKIIDFCNLYQGIFVVIASIFTILGGIYLFIAWIVPVISNVYLNWKGVLLFPIPLPTYILLIFLTFIILTPISSLVFYKKLKKRYSLINNGRRLFIGRWRNDWRIGNGAGHEIFYIGNDNKYIIDNITNPHRFNIENFKYDEKNKSITFYKKAVLPGDNRNLFNDLKIINNDKLQGSETGALEGTGKIVYDIAYTRISDR